jgi:anti-sigma factor RsiW
MCPDDQLLSAFADDEIPSPWKERVELHIGKCARCSEKVESIRTLSLSLLALDDPQDIQVLESAKLRIGASIDLNSARRRETRTGIAQRILALWSQRIQLPMPFAAAGILAFVLLAAMTLGVFNPLRKNTDTLAATSKVLASHATTLETLVRYLETQNSAQAVTIKMPGEAWFGQPGNPVLVASPVSDVQEITTTINGGATR